MFSRNRKKYAGERVLKRTRPNIFLHCKSVIIKIIIALLLISYFGSIVSFAAKLQMELVSYAHLPLVKWTVTVIVLLVLLLFFWSGWNLVSWRSMEYLLTNHRVVVQKGVIRRRKTYVHYEKIEDIAIYQSFLERILSSGDIEIYSGHENTLIVLEDVPHPEEIEYQINQLMESTFSNPRRSMPLPEKPKRKFSFSDPEYWNSVNNEEYDVPRRQNYETPEDFEDSKPPVGSNDQNDSSKPDKHIMERHSDKFKRKNR
ncbi:PH domain-containing protein [Methanobacterium alcaliphilum]|uniref:PH domain-containing protein n=1 Tax=Methanobacterium alcaliphilum TaxID=392018 RepID=UPI00200B68E0|nr:PH domain-containing protein [Methanobacterium alcaliphilum]MCK9152116.1 PH domain-containing protein [Methanobacterium alcaliphilum]